MNIKKSISKNSKRKFHQLRKDQLQRVLEKICNKSVTVAEASRRYKIREKSLQRAMKNPHGRHCSFGRPPSLSFAEENVIVQTVKSCARQGWGLTKTSILKYVGDILAQKRDKCAAGSWMVEIILCPTPRFVTAKGGGPRKGSCVTDGADFEKNYFDRLESAYRQFHFLPK